MSRVTKAQLLERIAELEAAEAARARITGYALAGQARVRPHTDNDGGKMVVILATGASREFREWVMHSPQGVTIPVFYPIDEIPYG